MYVSLFYISVFCDVFVIRLLLNFQGYSRPLVDKYLSIFNQQSYELFAH